MCRQGAALESPFAAREQLLDAGGRPVRFQAFAPSPSGRPVSGRPSMAAGEGGMEVSSDSYAAQAQLQQAHAAVTVPRKLSRLLVQGAAAGST